jgi:hypothetical protein
MRSEGLEPPTYKFVACCSIQLSYDRIIARRLEAGDLGCYNAPAAFPAARTTSENNSGERGIRTLDTVLSV